MRVRIGKKTIRIVFCVPDDRSFSGFIRGDFNLSASRRKKAALFHTAMFLSLKAKGNGEFSWFQNAWKPLVSLVARFFM